MRALVDSGVCMNDGIGEQLSRKYSEAEKKASRAASEIRELQLDVDRLEREKRSSPSKVHMIRAHTC